jgi:hypothetical protein
MQTGTIEKKLFISILSIFASFLFTTFISASIGSPHPNEDLKIYFQPATQRIDIMNADIIRTKIEVDNISLRVCKNEYEPFSLLLVSDQPIVDIKIEWNNFEGESELPDSIMEAFVVKGWYQAGITSKDIRYDKKKFTQELLLKNDSLVLVDTTTATNFLRIINWEGNAEYIDISSPESIFPDSVHVFDSDKLLPFSIDSNSIKQLWFTIKIPDNTIPGIYKNRIDIVVDDTIIKSQQIELEVLPFDLQSSIMTYGIFYHGMLKEYIEQYSYYRRNEEQLTMELTDLKNHGIKYPTTYNNNDELKKDLTIRKILGFPDDKIFHVDIDLFSNYPETDSEIDSLLSEVKVTKSIIDEMSSGQLYVYGVDEAGGKDLINQRRSWKAVKELGVKMFVAVDRDAINLVGDLLDVAILYGKLNPQQAEQYHSFGNEIFSYHNPQVGQEDPGIYRRNYGLALWKAGYDGAMNYAYFKSYGSVWNDFDDPKKRFREETFVYPTSNDLISTIQWEGFREGVDDVRYLSTLLSKIDQLKNLEIDVSVFNEWINEIDPNKNLDQLRNEIIDKILEIDLNYLSQ